MFSVLLFVVEVLIFCPVHIDSKDKAITESGMGTGIFMIQGNILRN